MAPSSKRPEQLQLAEFGDVPYDKSCLALVVKLLGETTTLDVVRAFLRSKAEHFSAGSWDEMRDKRLASALSRGAIVMGDLVALLSQVEEYGGTHSFLYKTTAANARNILADTAVKTALKKMGLSAILENPLILDQPTEATVASVRWDNDKRGRCLVAKVIESRTKLVPGQGENTDELLVKRWTKVPVRTVNVMRLYASGLLEIRVPAHTTSTDYTVERDALWRMLTDLIPPAGFQPLSLAKAKDALFNRKDEFKSRIRYTDSTLRDDHGATITAGTAGEQASLFQNKGASESVGTFLKHGGHCDEFNIWWIAQKNALPTKDIHMIISGEPQEFRITSSCTKEDFEYTFDSLYELV